MSAHFAPGTLKVLGTGSALPGAAVDTATLLSVVERVAGPGMARKGRLISRRLGIERRHLARRLDQVVSRPTPDAPALCIEALLQAAEQAGRDLGAMQYLIGHTTTPHTLVPPNISWVAERLHLPQPYLELRQACTGFANALQIAAPMLQAGDGSGAIAIVGSEVGSVYLRMERESLDQEQLVNVLQMGDGAGAVLLAAGEEGQGHTIGDMFIGHIGNDREPGLFLDGGGSGAVECASGLPLFRHHSQSVRQQGSDLYLAGLQAMQQRGYTLDDFAFILPHQVNGHLARLLGDYLQIDRDRIVVDADQLGNMGSAAIWVSFDRLRRSGRLAPGDKVLVLGAEATKYLYGGFVYQHGT
jgi:3-oxoacyl-[acyl-carrier-protein] synthase-3